MLLLSVLSGLWNLKISKLSLQLTGPVRDFLGSALTMLMQRLDWPKMASVQQQKRLHFVDEIQAPAFVCFLWPECRLLDNAHVRILRVEHG